MAFAEARRFSTSRVVSYDEYGMLSSAAAFALPFSVWLAMDVSDGEATPESLTASKLRAAFAPANPGRSANSFGLRLSERGWLREVLVCLDRRFRPRRCASPQAGVRDATAVKIWRGL